MSVGCCCEMSCLWDVMSEECHCEMTCLWNVEGCLLDVVVR